ncbi:MAG: hypothetical protein RR049_07775, partial [Angelakisella sp.]
DMAGAVEDYADRVEEAMRRAQEAKANANIPSHSGKSNSNSASNSSSNSNTSWHSDDYYDKKNNIDKDRTDRLASGGVAQYTGTHIVDELGAELQIPPDPPEAGRYALLKYGTTVVPADLSQRIMNMALNNPIRPSMSIQNMMPQMMPTNIHNITESPVVQIHGNLSFPNIHGSNEAHELIDELCKMGNNAYQRAWRR